MKKTLALLMVVLLCMSIFVGCGGNDTASSAAPEQAAPAQAAPAQAAPEQAAPAAEEDVLVLKLGDVLAEDHPHSKAHYYFAQRVNELTDGKVEVQVFVNSTLGNSRDLVEGLKLGTVHFTKSMTATLASYFPEISIFDLPYMFSGREHFYKVLDGEIGEYYRTEVMAQDDFLGLCYYDAGVRSIYNSKKPINTVDDLKGMILRVPESAIFSSTMDAFSCTGTPMPVGDVYTALQTGVIDGAENASVFYEMQKHYEAAPYFSNTEHMMTPDILMMSKSFFESLDPDIQEAILIAAEETKEFERQAWMDMENDAVESLKAAGVKINDVDKTGFYEAAEVVWDEYADVVGQDMIDKIQALK